MAEKIHPESEMFFNKERIQYKNSVIELIHKNKENSQKNVSDIFLENFMNFVNKEGNNKNGN
jgi:hypothetical protein